MASILVAHVLTDLGWRWMRVAGSRVVHLVPPRILQRSRTACSRLAVHDATLETPLGLLAEIERCELCARADS